MKDLKTDIKISDYDYELPDERIARFPLPERDASKLLVYERDAISVKKFTALGTCLPPGSLLVFNNTKVIRARLVMHKPSGARIEIFCLDPHDPSDYERAFAITGQCEWNCIVGNSKKWKEGPLVIDFKCESGDHTLKAFRVTHGGREQVIRFEWDAPLTFGQLLEHLGRIPIPPYLGRDSEELDNTRYQTVYSKLEGSVAAPTAGLHFTPELIGKLTEEGFRFGEITLHVGAGTFLPVKTENPKEHSMHVESFGFSRGLLEDLINNEGRVIPVGTTTVRTLESLTALGYRIMCSGQPDPERPVGQWELYGIPENIAGKELLEALLFYMRKNEVEKMQASTGIMIMPGYSFRVTNGMITNFHQPRSTLLLLVSAFIGEDWRQVYRYALDNGFRFLSYGDSNLLLP